MSGPMQIVIVGHVDHGKSTLIGRLVHDSGAMPEGRIDAIRAMCERRDVPFEWAFLTDALKAERDQQITIDTTQFGFETEHRDYVIVDAPGHREFLNNMLTGAASASAALVLVAADEGICEQTRRHAYMLSLLGIEELAVVVTKMDLVDYSEPVFDELEREFRAFLADIGLEARTFIPVSARNGDTIAQKCQTMPWWNGPTIVEQLDAFERPARADALRFPIQDVYEFDGRRILVGRIEAGHIERGDELVFLPTRHRTKVASIENWNRESARAEQGISVGITLEDEVLAKRGHIAVHPGSLPALASRIEAHVFWMGEAPLRSGSTYTLKLTTQMVAARVTEISAVVDTSSLEVTRDVTEVRHDDVGRVVLETDTPIWFDDHQTIAATGRFVLVDRRKLAGGGIALEIS